MVIGGLGPWCCCLAGGRESQVLLARAQGIFPTRQQWLQPLPPPRPLAAVLHALYPCPAPTYAVLAHLVSFGCPLPQCFLGAPGTWVQGREGGWAGQLGTRMQFPLLKEHVQECGAASLHCLGEAEGVKCPQVHM